MNEIPVPSQNWLIKHPKWSLVIFILYTIFIGGSGWVIAFKTHPYLVKNEITQQSTQIFGDKTGAGETIQPQENCYKEELSQNGEKWETKFYREEDDGFWCPKRDLDHLIWYKAGLNVNFKKIRVEYKIRKDKRVKSDNPPSFIFGWGEEERPIFKLWVPENPNLQLFRFAKSLNFNSEVSTLSADLAQTLSDPVKTGMTDSLVIVPSYIEGNDLFLNFTYGYTSSVTSKGEHDTFPKNVKLPISDVQSSSKKFPFGVGTYIGNCIGEVSYEICQ